MRCGKTRRRPPSRRKNRLRAVLAWAVAYLAGVSLAPQLGRAQDDLLEPPPADSLVLPSYSTSYDRDHTREAWGQDLYYGLDRKRTSFNVTGSTDTQRFLRLPNKSTHGSINGQLNYGLIGTWQLVLRGWYDMNSSVNGPSFDDSRNNRINIQTQYLLLRPGGLQGNFYAYTEFERKQDLNRNSSIAHDPSDSTVVDSLVASRDSSYTTSRNDAVSAEITWPARRWLELRETAMVFRSQPVITSRSSTRWTALRAGGAPRSGSGPTTRRETGDLRPPRPIRTA